MNGATSTGKWLGRSVFLLIVACSPRIPATIQNHSASHVEIGFAESPRVFSASEKAAVRQTAERAFQEVKRHLPRVPDSIVLLVRAGSDVIDATGEAAFVVPPNHVQWTIDPGRKEGVLGIVSTQLRPTLFHELLHLARATVVTNETLMDSVIDEGLATVFERDVAGSNVPWGTYPSEVVAWVKELKAQHSSANRSKWLIAHPDGRRWIGLRAGTYLVDQAIAKSGRSVQELAILSTAEVLRLALGD